MRFAAKSTDRVIGFLPWPCSARSRVCQAGSDFFRYFSQQGFEVLRPNPSEAIVPVAPVPDIIGDSATQVGSYTVLGLQPAMLGRALLRRMPVVPIALSMPHTRK